MICLPFPANEIFGTLEWPGCRTDWPVLATGAVMVPDDSEITLSVSRIEEVLPCSGPDIGIHINDPHIEAHGESALAAQGFRTGWEVKEGNQSLDLEFLRRLPAGSIRSLNLTYWILPESFSAVTHLAPGLRSLRLAATALNDTALQTVAQLYGILELQTFGNQFTDEGVQQLAALQDLEDLYMEERGLSVLAFEFAARLPHLVRIAGLGEVPMSTSDLSWLKARLPGVDIC
jgi:hypothetical protein